MRLFQRNQASRPSFDPDAITIVSGLPRSGTSMMMKMLSAGGLDVLTDNLRTADESNPKGYFELERVKKLKDGDRAWLGQAQGKAVKVISALLEHLPPEYRYKVIFMRRNMPEVLASQRQMLIGRGEEPGKVSDEQMTELFTKHLARVEAWLAGQPNMDVIYIHYNEVLADPRKTLPSLVEFMEGRVKLDPMLSVVDQALYRQRSASSPG